MSRVPHAQRLGRVLRDAQHVMLRGVPLSATSQDLRRMVGQADLKGVTDVSVYYRHFRPTGKAILTMALPDYTRDAVRDVKNIIVPGSTIIAEAIENPAELDIRQGPWSSDEKIDSRTLGNGPGAGVPEGRTVTITGLPGKASVDHLKYLLKGFRLAKDRVNPVQPAPQPIKKYTLYSRYTVYFDSESEARRFVRKTHMTRFRNMHDAPVITASVIC